MKDITHTLYLQLPIHESFEFIFNNNDLLDFMNKKNGYTTTNWENDKRVLQYNLPIEGVPNIIKKFLINNYINVITNQHIKYKTDDYIRIENKIFPKVLGSSFVKIRSTFSLIKLHDNLTRFNVNSRFYVYVSPLINTTIEKYMLVTSKENFKLLNESIEYVETLKNKKYIKHLSDKE